MADDTLDQMLANYEADSWSDISESTDFEFDNDRLSALERVEEYVGYCFETYPIVYNTLDRQQVTVCVADWDRRRGQARRNKTMERREFGKRVPRTYERRTVGKHSLFLAKDLVGVPPEDDNGVGWKATTRHELGHIIDYAKRGESGHGPKFKKIMAQFGERQNDGASTGGWAPRKHR